MYLKQLHVENNGPLQRLAIDFPFAGSGLPVPVVLVGANGSGKTNLQSIVADALFEAAAKHYTNVFVGMTQFSHDWFRVGGGSVTTSGKAHQFSVLRFDHEGKIIWFREKHGLLSSADAQAIVAQSLKAGIAWQPEGSSKEITLDDPTSEKMFESGAYVYFSSSRAEHPHWLNRDALPTEFDVTARFTKRLRKPIFVERSLHQFSQWLLSVMNDARTDVGSVFQMLSFVGANPTGQQQ